VIRLVCVYDEECPSCRRAARWLATERSYVPLRTLPARSDLARALLPDLVPGEGHADLQVVGSGGQVWTGASAWRTALWALWSTRRAVERTTRGEFEAAAWRAPHPALPPVGSTPGIAASVASQVGGATFLLALLLLPLLLLGTADPWTWVVPVLAIGASVVVAMRAHAAARGA
jgi:hypothetical protein